MANPELGAKQVCPNCQSKFYDLGRRPAVCPKCGETFDPEEAIRSRRVRARTATPDYDRDDEPAEKPAPDQDGFEDEVDNTPEIDEAAAETPIEADEDADVDPQSPAAPADDLGVDFAADEDAAEEDADDVPFLEDEDDFDEDEIEGLPDEGDTDH